MYVYGVDGYKHASIRDVLLAEGGHDSLEDAVSCMDLMKWKVKEDIKKEVRQMAHAQQQLQV